MNILVVNSGSSSIKYQLFTMPDEQPVCSGLVERIGLDHALITHKVFVQGEERVLKQTTELADHKAGLQHVAGLLVNAEWGVIQSPGEIAAVGHRVVHGGKEFAATTIIDAAVKEKIKSLFQLAPLHNPANYLGIEVAERIFTQAKQVAVFDTAFHQTMPPRAYLYAIPPDFNNELNIRSYGFHGTSHKYVSEKAIEYLGKAETKVITLHLGNGCSMAAIHNGRSIDTSMGFGPLSGLIMGTRSGDIDPSVIFYLVNQLGYDLEQVNTLLNKRSGMLGLTGLSDMRDIGHKVAEGEKAALLAVDLYAYRVKKYIGAYTAILNGLDALVFTAGVGENDVATRLRICTGLDYLGIVPDEEKNAAPNNLTREINTAESRVKILVVPTNEELEIGKQCYHLLTG